LSALQAGIETSQQEYCHCPITHLSMNFLNTFHERKQVRFDPENDSSTFQLPNSFTVKSANILITSLLGLFPVSEMRQVELEENE
jgi:hypothetical protein